MENLSNQSGWILSRQHPAAATNKLSPDEKVWIIKNKLKVQGSIIIFQLSYVVKSWLCKTLTGLKD